MARSSSLRAQKQSLFLRIFPESWQDYLLERLRDLRALIVTFTGCFFMLALVSYHAEDPSLNTAANPDNIHNFMGRPGAYLSDFLVQIFGVGSIVLAIGFLVWGWRLWKKDDFGPLWGRMIALLSAALLLGIAGGAVPGGAWISHATMGGAGG
ncbi:MAG TPA: DNA translocase FtsK 4TM domain-containing protein, partial [Alphaproteobacteria bacterium]|nr:DNA translocase FtsK 4TM domain-containing protein [Alphaproteobacteria bacterium]